MRPRSDSASPGRRARPPLAPSSAAPQAAAATAGSAATWPGVIQTLHVPPKARRVIWLYMAGGMTHLDTFDHKPKLAAMNGQPMPESFTKGQQIAQLQGKPLNCFGPQHAFRRVGQSGQEICEIFPEISARIADRIAIVRSMHTEAINHDPAHTFMNTGSMITGRPAAGSWLWYGLGSDAPAGVVGGDGDQRVRADSSRVAGHRAVTKARDSIRGSAGGLGRNVAVVVAGAVGGPADEGHRRRVGQVDLVGRAVDAGGRVPGVVLDRSGRDPNGRTFCGSRVTGELTESGHDARSAVRSRESVGDRAGVPTTVPGRAGDPPYVRDRRSRGVPLHRELGGLGGQAGLVGTGTLEDRP